MRRQSKTTLKLPQSFFNKTLELGDHSKNDVPELPYQVEFKQPDWARGLRHGQPSDTSFAITNSDLFKHATSTSSLRHLTEDDYGVSGKSKHKRAVQGSSVGIQKRLRELAPIMKQSYEGAKQSIKSINAKYSTELG